ncbi:hypothetical protein AAC03nite_05040 [Alicyclobacillus acidoterrestris]|nr:hypothetical protein AAC03nite_05040 [Alicyclobacillus acidoterrestris]
MSNVMKNLKVLLDKERFGDFYRESIEQLKSNTGSDQLWGLLGLYFLKMDNGLMAERCFKRAQLLNPFIKGIDQALSRCLNTSHREEIPEISELLLPASSSVAALVLTRNSSRTIRDCLSALKGAVDQIVVVDTGSTDDTIDIVKQMGEAVHSFHWCDDFSQARNFALRFVETDWVIAIDSDEILFQSDRKCIKQVAGIFAGMRQPVVLGINQVNKVPNRIESCWQFRMFRTDQGLAWESPIHEYVVPQDPTEQVDYRYVNIRVLHDGYDPSAVSRQDKFRRNVEILRRVVKNDPDNLDMRYYLGRDAFHLGQYQEALENLEEAYRLSEIAHRFNNPMIDVFLILTLEKLERYRDAEHLARRMTQKYPQYPDGHYLYARLMFARIHRDLNEVFNETQTARNLAVSYKGPHVTDQSLARWKTELTFADLSRMQGDLKKTRDICRRVLKNYPDTPKTVMEALVTLENNIMELAEDIRSDRSTE